MKKRHAQNHTAGITLIELLVVVGIVAIVSSVVLFNYSNFSTNVSLRNLAQEMALTVRKGQSYATSVQYIQGSGGSTTLYPAYGIAFSTASLVSDQAVPSQKRFILFADANTNGRYDRGTGACGSATTECLEGFGITTPDTIVEICNLEPYTCYTTGGGDSMIVTFNRPSPNANICVIPGSSSSCLGGTSGVAGGGVKVRSAKGLTQLIRVWNTGQISVQ
jgi:type II secretory pathway pseudopilin PulG